MISGFKLLGFRVEGFVLSGFNSFGSFGGIGFRVRENARLMNQQQQLQQPFRRACGFQDSSVVRTTRALPRGT